MKSRQKRASDTVRRQRQERTMGKPTLFVLFCCAAAVLGGILLYLWPQMRLVDLGYREGALQRRHMEALHRYKELRLELVSLSQLSRIEEVATKFLGLRSPQSQGTRIIYVRPQHNPQHDLQTVTREP